MVRATQPISKCAESIAFLTYKEGRARNGAVEGQAGRIVAIGGTSNFFDREPVLTVHSSGGNLILRIPNG